MVGPYAAKIETMSDREIATEATATLRAMFGEDIVPDPVGCAHSSWGSDPFARGSWTYFPYRGDFNTTNGTLSTPGSELMSQDAHVVDSLSLSLVDGSAPLLYCSGETDSYEECVGSGAVVSQAETSPEVPAAAWDMDKRSSAAVSAQSLCVSSSKLPEPPFSFSAESTCPSSHSSLAHDDDDEGHHHHIEGLVAPDSSSSSLTGHSHSDDSGDGDSDGDELSSVASSSNDSTSSSSSSDDDLPMNSPFGREEDMVNCHVYYASEAMSVINRGTAHGAYMSGMREANRILAYLN